MKRKCFPSSAWFFSLPSCVRVRAKFKAMQAVFWKRIIKRDIFYGPECTWAFITKPQGHTQASPMCGETLLKL